MRQNLMRQAAIWDGSSLLVDFAAMRNHGELANAGFTFTRGANAYFYGSDGLLIEEGADIPRLDHDPVTLAPRGLLCEGGATNLVCWSCDFLTSGGVNNWADTSITRDIDAPISPTGKPSGIRITGTATDGYLRNDLALSSASRTFSVWLRREIGSGDISLSLDNSTYTVLSGVTSAWKRFEITATSTAHVSIRIKNGNVVDVFGAQVETGTGATSLICTEDAANTRDADVCTLPLGSWFNASTGTIVAKLEWGSRAVAQSGIELSVGTGSSNNDRIQIRTSNVSYLAGGTTSASFTPTVTSGSVRIGTAYDVNDFAIRTNGGAVSTDSLGQVPQSLDTLKFYTDSGGTTTRFVNGWIRSFKYWPIRLSNDALLVETT